VLSSYFLSFSGSRWSGLKKWESTKVDLLSIVVFELEVSQQRLRKVFDGEILKILPNGLATVTWSQTEGHDHPHNFFFVLGRMLNNK
jgi:hypothetical protein